MNETNNMVNCADCVVFLCKICNLHFDVEIYCIFCALEHVAYWNFGLHLNCLWSHSCTTFKGWVTNWDLVRTSGSSLTITHHSFNL